MPDPQSQMQILPQPSYAALPVMRPDVTDQFGPPQFARVQYPQLQSVPGIIGGNGAGGTAGMGPPGPPGGGGMLASQPPSKQAIPNVQGAVQSMPAVWANHGWWHPWMIDPSVQWLDPFNHPPGIEGKYNPAFNYAGQEAPIFHSAPVGNSITTMPGGGFSTPAANFGGGSPGGLF